MLKPTQRVSLNAMTALENMTDSNLRADQTTFLPKKRFEKVSKAMRDEAKAYVAANPLDDKSAFDQRVEAAFLGALPAKLLDLNRRPLNRKILELAAEWNVPLDDFLNEEALARAIKARNNVVHRGWYYEPAQGSAAQRDLWDHVLLMREIVIRFILTAVGYRGAYISFRGGQHDVALPPPERNKVVQVGRTNAA